MAGADGGQGVKLFVGQVPAICSEDQLSAIFGQFGDIVDIQIMRDKATQRSKGSAWVSFKDASAAEDAILTLHGKHSIPPQSNPLQIRYAGKQAQQQQPRAAVPPGAAPLVSAAAPLASVPVGGDQPPPSRYMPPQPMVPSVPGMMGGPWDPSQGGMGDGLGMDSPPHSPSPGGVPGNVAQAWAGAGNPMAAHHGGVVAKTDSSPRRRGGGGGGRGGDRRFPSRGGRKLFVGQLPKSMTQQEVQALMQPFGEIEELHVMQDRRTGQGTGAAFCIFANREQALAAIDSLNGKHTAEGMGQPMQVRFAEGEVDREKEAKLFVGQVPYAATENDLQQLFGQFGHLTEVALVRKGGHSKGCGFVRYQDREAADCAIAQLNGQHVMQGSHSPLTVRFADSELEKRKRREGRNQPANVNQISGMMGRLQIQGGGGMPMQMPFNPGMQMGQMPMQMGQMPMGQMGQMPMMPMMGYGGYPGMPMGNMPMQSVPGDSGQ